MSATPAPPAAAGTIASSSYRPRSGVRVASPASAPCTACSVRRWGRPSTRWRCARSRRRSGRHRGALGGLKPERESSVSDERSRRLAVSSPPTPVDGFIDANGVRLHYVDWGHAGQPPLLLLHGGSAHAHWWDFVVPALGARHRCIALDLRGHGDSGWSTMLDYRLETHAADVAAAVDALDLR